jgi:hypothetical protein
VSFEQIGPWLDRVGLLAQFVSFWLIAPEFIGGEKMQVVGKAMAKFLSTTLFITITIGIIAVAWSLAFREGIHWFHRASLALLFSSIVLIPKLLLFRKFKTTWLPNVINHLSSDEGFRKGLFLVGGVLFSIGTALQIAATF